MPRSILAILISIFMALCSSSLRAADSVLATLTYQDLVNHSDRWPVKTTLTQTLHFQNGAALQTGQQVTVHGVQAGGVQVMDDKNVGYTLRPEQCDVVDAANAIWSKLTPEQRNLTLAAIQSDMDSWPVKVKLIQPIKFPSGKNLTTGTEVDFIAFKKGQPDFITIAAPDDPNSMLNIPASLSDIVPRCRDLLSTPLEQRPSRIVAQLKGHTVDSTGKPIDFPDAGIKYFVLYYGAGWCPPCQAFSPDLVAYQKQIATQHPEIAFILISEEDWQAAQGRTSSNYDADMMKYMGQESMTWPAVTVSEGKKSPALVRYATDVTTAIPILIVVDRAGKTVVNGQDAAGNFTQPDAPWSGALDQLKKLSSTSTPVKMAQ